MLTLSLLTKCHHPLYNQHSHPTITQPIPEHTTPPPAQAPPQHTPPPQTTETPPYPHSPHQPNISAVLDVCLPDLYSPFVSPPPRRGGIIWVSRQVGRVESTCTRRLE